MPTDAYRVRTGIFSALIFGVCILVTFLMCVGKMTTLTGTRVDSETAELKNAKRLKNIQQQVNNEVIDNEKGKKDESRFEESPLKEVVDEE